LGVPNPERRRPHGSIPRGQNPTASICATPPLLTTDVRAVWGCAMNSPICVTNFCVTNRKQTASFSIAGLILAIMPLSLMLAVANTSAQTQTTSSPADWTQFLRDNMQRYNPYETVLNVNNVGRLQLKWSFYLGSMAGGQFSSPAVVNGVVYVGSSDNDSVYAVNASTGAKLSSLSTGGAVYSSPAVANGVVYFG
jgi:glucose dehydrogenase